MKKIGLMYSLCLLFVFSCNKDSEITTVVEENIPPLIVDELTDRRNSIITGLAGNSAKVWKISDAILVTENNTIDINGNFNIEDDEFIFSKNSENNKLEWRRGHAINTNANMASETLLDYYLSPKKLDLKFKTDQVELLTEDGLMNITLTDNVPTGVIHNGDGSKIRFTLTEKKPEDYYTPPSGDFEFSEVLSFRSDRIEGAAPGMIGSYSDNSLFVVTRHDPTDVTKEEVIHKFDLTNNEQTASFFPNDDFISKQLHIVNNELVVVGAQYINNYNSDLSGTPSSVEHGKTFTRFGMAVQDDNIYIIGGEFNPPSVNNEKANKVYKWNLVTKSLTEFATLPEARFGARATIVNDKLYIFGGSPLFFDGLNSSEILVTSLSDPGKWEKFYMSNVMQFTFVNKYQNLIYVAGKTRHANNNVDPSTESFIGVFDTNTNEYTPINNNLETFKEVERDGIQQMCLFNDRMYVLYGSGYEPNNPHEQEQDWKIYATDLK